MLYISCLLTYKFNISSTVIYLLSIIVQIQSDKDWIKLRHSYI